MYTIEPQYINVLITFGNMTAKALFKKDMFLYFFYSGFLLPAYNWDQIIIKSFDTDRCIFLTLCIKK